MADLLYIGVAAIAGLAAFWLIYRKVGTNCTP